MSKKAFAVLGLAAASVATAVQAQDQVLDGYNDAAYAKAFYRYEFGGASPLLNEHRLGFIANGTGNTQTAPMVEYRQAASGKSMLMMSGMPVRMDGQNIMLNANGEQVSVFRTPGFWVVVGGTALISGIAIADDDDERLSDIGTGISGGGN